MLAANATWRGGAGLTGLRSSFNAAIRSGESVTPPMAKAQHLHAHNERTMGLSSASELRQIQASV
jgi:hypothetical protein